MVIIKARIQDKLNTWIHPYLASITYHQKPKKLKPFVPHFKSKVWQISNVNFYFFKLCEFVTKDFDSLKVGV